MFPYKVFGETSAHLHIFMARSRISKIRLKAELCFHRPSLGAFCLCSDIIYIYINQSVFRQNRLFTNCVPGPGFMLEDLCVSQLLSAAHEN